MGSEGAPVRTESPTRECIPSFLSHICLRHTQPLNKFAYFYAMSSRHQKEQAAPFPAPFLSPLLLSVNRLTTSRFPGSSSAEESEARDFQRCSAHTGLDTSFSFSVLGRANRGMARHAHCQKELTGGSGSSFIIGVPIRTIYFARNWKPESNLKTK